MIKIVQYVMMLSDHEAADFADSVVRKHQFAAREEMNELSKQGFTVRTSVPVRTLISFQSRFLAADVIVHTLEKADEE